MKRLGTLIGLSALLVALNACGVAPTNTPTTTPTPPPSSTPTLTPPPTATPTPSPTPTTRPTPTLPAGAIARFKCGTGYIIAYSPDGTLLAAASREAFFICDMETLKLQVTIVPEREATGGVSWSPDGTRLASGSEDGMVQVWDVTTGEELTAFKVSNEEYWRVAWSPDGERVATADGDLHIWDVTTGKELVTMTSPTKPNDYVVLAWSPDGRRVAGGRACGVVDVWDATTGQELAYLPYGRSLGRSVFSVAWSPDGKRLASGLGELMLVYDTVTGEELVAITECPIGIPSLAWSPDGRWLAGGALSARVVQVWDTSTWEEIIIFRYSRDVYSVAWSPDGKYLASGHDNGTVILWDVSQLP